MILFEIVHEAAFFMSKDIIATKLLEKECNTPVESIVGNNNGYPNVINTMYADPPLISNVMYKLQSSFYDTEDDRLEYIVPVNYRYSKYAIISAQTILNWVNQNNDDYSEILTILVTDTKNCPEPPKGYFIQD